MDINYSLSTVNCEYCVRGKEERLQAHPHLNVTQQRELPSSSGGNADALPHSAYLTSGRRKTCETVHQIRSSKDDMTLCDGAFPGTAEKTVSNVCVVHKSNCHSESECNVDDCAEEERSFGRLSLQNGSVQSQDNGNSQQSRSHVFSYWCLLKTR